MTMPNMDRFYMSEPMDTKPMPMLMNQQDVPHPGHPIGPTNKEFAILNPRGFQRDHHGTAIPHKIFKRMRPILQESVQRLPGRAMINIGRRQQ